MDKTQQGLNILDSIRSSLGIPKVETQTRLPGPAPTSAFIETTVTPRPVPQANLKPLTPQPKAGIPGRELFDVSPVGKPLYTPLKEQIRQVTAPKQLYTPTQARITPLNLEQPLIKFPLEKIAKPLGQGTDKILSAINFAQKAKGKSTWERALEGVSGAGEILSIPNEVLIQPTWDLTKIGIKAIVQGNVTKDDVKKAYYAVGSEKNTLGDALGLDEKTTNPVVFQAVRLIDFLPELIDIPTTSAIKGGAKFVKYAKEVPTESKAFDDALEQGAKAFEDATGEAVTPEAKEIIKNIRNNPEELANIASTSDNLLIQEAKKYKTADEFVKAQGTPVYHGSNTEIKDFDKNKFGLTTGESGYFGDGFYFTSDKNYAEFYAKQAVKKRGGVETINEVFLIYKKPFLINEQTDISLIEKLSGKKKFIDGATVADTAATLTSGNSNFTNNLKKQGYDSIIIDFGNNRPNEILVFDKSQIKTKSQLNDIWKQAQKAEPSGLIKPTERALEGVPTADFGGAIPPSGGIPTFLPEMGKVLPTKERKFPGTVKNAKGTAKEVKGILNDRIDLYSPIKNKDEFARAAKFVDENEIDDVIDYIKFTDDPREVSYIGQALMKKLQDTKNFARVIDVLDIVSEQGTRSGQAIQALSVWGRLTPEGALRSANNLVRQYNLDNKLTEGMPGFIKLTESQAKKIQDQANKLARITDEYERLKEASKLQREIADVVPASLGTKIATIQTLAQLLNPKTFIRNVLGNAIFGSIDSLTQSFATPLDLAISLFTKQRTIAPASFKRQFEGGVQGFRKGMQEALEGADTSQLASQFDLPNGSVFDSKVMQGLEKALNVSLRAPDRAFYEATYKDTLEGLMKLNKVDKPTKEMLEIAHYEGLRRTFQDDNRVSRLFTSAKRALNYIGTKDRSFGLGDIILKYPKTPANLLVRALEYTPVGYVRALYELSKPLFKIGPFDQRAFVNNVARATVGTGMINLGLSLGKLGIITPRPDSDKDARAAQDLQGLQAYSFNTSALKRYVLSGFDAEAAKPRVGDQLVSYDWAQPASLPLAMGANMAENENKIKEGTFSERVLLTFGPLAGEIIRSSDTLTEQSLLQGIQRLFGPGGLQQGIIDNLMAVPGSFVPTILNQINQFTDNASRETYSPDLVEASFNQFSARVPILSQTLPQRVDILGRPKERFPNAQNTFFNVFFNPAFVDQIKDDPVLKETIQLYEETGEKGQFPRLVDKSITVNGERKLLTTQELVDYQTNVGQVSDQIMRKAISNEQYQKLPTQEKALFLANILSDVNKTTKVRLFGESMEGLSGRQEMLFANDLDNYLIETLNNKQEQLRKEQLKAQGLGYTKVRLPSIRKPRARALPKPKKLKLKASRIKPIGRKRTKRLQVATLKPRKEKRNTQTA